MEREIQFEEIPEKMQNDWCNFLNTWKGESVKILSIRFYSSKSHNSIYYKIYFDFDGVVGVGIYNSGAVFETSFQMMSIADIKELYKLSDRL